MLLAQKGQSPVVGKKFFYDMGERGQAFVIRENITEDQVLITLEEFSKTWIIADSKNIFAQPKVSASLICGTFYPAFKESQRVLYLELQDNSYNTILRSKVTKQIGTTTLKSTNYIAPWEGVGPISYAAWYGGMFATGANKSGVLVDIKAYSTTKTSLEALQIDKTDIKGW